MNSDNDFVGFDELSKMLSDITKGMNEAYISDVLEVGASEFVDILLKLPNPISNIKKNGYTHLVDTFAYKKNKAQIEVGWGKYYGPFVEHGTSKMRAIPHMMPAWKSNKDKIYQIMIDKIDFMKG